MLSNPKWEKTTDTKPSLAGFIAWLETKDVQHSYEWMKCDGACAVDQYLLATTALGTDSRVEDYLLMINLDILALGRPRTFGALLDRARKAAA